METDIKLNIIYSLLLFNRQYLNYKSKKVNSAHTFFKSAREDDISYHQQNHASFRAGVTNFG